VVSKPSIANKAET